MTGVPESTWSLMIPFITAPGLVLKENRTVTLGGLQASVGPGVLVIRELGLMILNQHEQPRLV